MRIDLISLMKCNNLIYAEIDVMVPFCPVQLEVGSELANLSPIYNIGLLFTFMGQSLPCCKEDDQPTSTINPIPIASNPSHPNREKTTQIPAASAEQFKPKPHGPRSRVGTLPKIQRQGSKPSNYQSIRILGKGSFGMVVLVQQKSTTKKYSMKMIPKSKINELNLLQTPLLPEIRNHPFLVPIYQTFKYNENIYIVMQYLQKGDLYFYTKKQGIELEEATIRSVLAEIIIGMEYLHSQNIVYRELKPENILITDEGHVKLTDYAFSKLIDSQKEEGISTFKGAIQYMAPEIIKEHFGGKADVWALGIVAYELKFRENPIENEGKTNYSIPEYEELIKNDFLQGKINSKIGYMTHEFRELLIELLEKDPEIRISLEQLRKHSFFQGIEWSLIEDRTNEPPLFDLIKDNDYIRFRDPTNEESRRQQIVQRHGTRVEGGFEVNLMEIRNEV